MTTNNQYQHLIRTATIKDAEQIANVQVKSWQESYQGLIDQEYLDSLPQTWDQRVERWKIHLSDTKALTFVVVDQYSKIVGFIRAGVARDSQFEKYSEIYAFYLLKSHQKIGLGKHLLQTTLFALKNLQFQKTYLWVLEKNPTILFYERNGGIFSGKKKIANIGGKNVTELYYFWEL